MSYTPLSLMNTHVIGGQGKTTHLISEFLKAAAEGGALFIDPHGGAIDTILSLCPKRDTLVIDPTDVSYPVGFNVLYDVRNKPLLASLILATVKAIWKYDKIATPVLDRTLFNTLSALLEYPNASLLDIDQMLTDKDFRASVLERVSDPYLKRKWAYWNRKKEKDWDALISSTENKAGEFTEDPRIRAIIGEDTTFDLRRLMFDRGLVLLKLPRGQLGHKTTMFGSLFLAYSLSVAYERKGIFPFHIFIDDVEHFDTPVVLDLLADGKRQNVNVTLAHQYLAQLSPELKSAVLNADRRVIFKTGIEDSVALERTMPENNTRPKPHELLPFQMLEIEGAEIRWDRYVKPLPRGSKRRAKQVVEQSRRRYGRPSVKRKRR